MADCERIINVTPEDDEQQIEVSPEQEAQNIGVDAEQGEQIIDVQSAPEAEALEIEQENCEECIFGGRECISVSGIASYTPLTDKPSINGTVLEGDKTLEELGFEDAITDVKVNGTSLPITDKSVDVSVPTKTSDLTNDSDFITQADIPEIPTKTSELENDSGFITSADIPEVPTKTSQLDNDSGFITSADIPEVPTKTSELENDSGFITDTSLGNYYTKTQTDGLVQSEASAREQADNALAGQISANTQQITQNTNTLSTHGQQISQNTLNLAQEQLSRQNGDNTLQAQIDAISAASDVVDVVGTYTDLQNYDTSKLTADDIVKVLNDENHDNATTYYRWNGSWSFVGSEGSHYTKAEADATFVPQTRTINGQALDENVELDIPTKTSELTNDAGFITASSVPTKTSDLANDSGFIDSSALDDYYDKTETDTLLADKQDKLTAGDNITIDQETNTISATGGGSSVNDATLTIQKNGTNVATFTANSATNQTANITVPTATSDLSNDSGFITSADVPTKTSELTNDSGFITSSDVPTATSELTNDSGFITSADLPTIDSTLSTSSTNAVENQAIANAIDLKYDKTGGEITGNAKVDGTFTLDIEDEDYDAGINFTRTLDNNLGTTLTLTGYAGGTNYRTLLRNIATPNSDYDVANKKYVDDHILTPVNYLVALDQNGAIDLVSSSLNYATVKAYLTNNSKDVYLDVLYEPSRFYAKAVQDEDTNNGPINFIGSYSRGGKFYTALFMLDSSDNLSVLHLEPQLTYEKAQAITSTNISSTAEYPSVKAIVDWTKDWVNDEFGPHIIYQTDGTTGLLGVNSDWTANSGWQLSSLDMTPYKRLKFYIRMGEPTGAGAVNRLNPSQVIEMTLDSRSTSTTGGGEFIASAVSQNPADRNVLFITTAVVSSDKTKVKIQTENSLYGTALGGRNDSSRFCYLIEGYKN